MQQLREAAAKLTTDDITVLVMALQDRLAHLEPPHGSMML